MGRFKSGDVLQHFKGGTYMFMDEATHSEDPSQKLVIYCNEEARIWVRPAESFYSDVTKPDGTVVPRFEKISSIQELGTGPSTSIVSILIWSALGILSIWGAASAFHAGFIVMAIINVLFSMICAFVVQGKI